MKKRSARARGHNLTYDALRRAIDSRTTKVSIIGLGYVRRPRADIH